MGRAPFLFTGLALFAIKFNLDRLIAYSFNNRWQFFQYWLPDPVRGSILDPRNRSLLLALTLTALPFIYVGLIFTLKRLRSAQLPLWLVVIFFIPFVNLVLFATLSLVPPSYAKDSDFSLRGSRWLPRSPAGMMAAGVLAFIVCALLGTYAALHGRALYGSSLFMGTPFAAGLACGLLVNARADQGYAKTAALAVSALFISGLALFGLMVEGIICLAMALPFAIPIALIGAAIGRLIAVKSMPRPPQSVMVGVLLLLTPGMSSVERFMHPVPESFAIRSEVIVDAPPQVVWKNVVSFAELAPPTEAIFKTGIAYPIRAEITGQGPGAVRRCVFSTGAFVEPITEWQAPRRLAFSVQEQPPVMHEMSWKPGLVPAHISDQYLRSTRGEFLLEPLPGNRTRLVGTTWYDLQFWPSSYWHLWSDAIIHRIHMRVLDHVKGLSEKH